MHVTMFKTLASDKVFAEQKMVHLYCTPTSNFSFIWRLLLFRNTAQYTSPFRMWNYAVSSEN